MARAGAGPLVVIAGPGSGKTRTLVARIVTLIGERGVRPEQILALTFTNRAAGEIRVRLRASLPSVAGLGRLFVGTFHSLALALLREAGLPCEPVLDEAEARQALALAMRLAGVAGKVRDAAQAISLAKASGDPAGALAGSPHASAWAAYQAHLAASGARDYDDVLLELRRALRADAALRVCTCERFPHVLVDEFQDVNAVQYDLVRLLAGDGGGLMVIGDPDQAIYGFRGASPRHFALLGQDFPRSQVFRLDTNYRSQPGIVATARALMGAGRPAPAPAPAGPGSGTQAQADGPVAAPVRVWRVPGETAEGIAIVREIDRLLGGADMLRADGGGAGGRSLNDFGVLFRTGAQARALEECFSRAGLPYRVLGQKAFLEADSVRAALCFARYVLDPDSFLRRAHALLQAPFRPARMAAETAWQALLAAEAGAELPPALREARARLERTARDCRDRVGDAAAFVAGWTRACGQEPDADLAELARVAAHSGSLADLLARLRWGREGDIERYGSAAAPGGEAVSLLTLHAAKGLEFPVVFICGVEEGLIPMRERGTDLEEERRLLYVGMTRARDELILLHAQSRPRRGERVRPALSSFVAELPPGLLAHEEADGQRRGRRPEQLSLF